MTISSYALSPNGYLYSLACSYCEISDISKNYSYPREMTWDRASLVPRPTTFSVVTEPEQAWERG